MCHGSQGQTVFVDEMGAAVSNAAERWSKTRPGNVSFPVFVLAEMKREARLAEECETNNRGIE